MTEPIKPTCFGSNPSYQAQAENDCETCSYNKECLTMKPIIYNPALHVIVPIKPTVEMLDAYNDVSFGDIKGDRAAYKAMLSAAPPITIEGTEHDR